MPHTPEEKKRALARTRRIQGQLGALERALEAEEDCEAVLQQITSIRGAVNGLLSQVIEAHIRENFVASGRNAKVREDKVTDLVKIVRAYFK